MAASAASYENLMARMKIARARKQRRTSKHIGSYGGSRRHHQRLWRVASSVASRGKQHV